MSKEDLLRVAQPLLGVFSELTQADPRRAVVQQQFETAMGEIDEFVLSSLDRATQKCGEYNSRLVGLNSEIFGKTDHFRIPVCNGEPDMRNLAHIREQFQVFQPYNLTAPDRFTYVRVNAQSVVTPQAQARSRTYPHLASMGFLGQILDGVFSHLLGIKTALAHFDVIFFNNQAVPIENFRRMAPLSAMVSPAATITSFKMISREDAKRNLPFYLKVISTFAGK